MSPKPLLAISVETVTACNLRCTYCPNSRSDRGSIQNLKWMDSALFIKLIDDLAELHFAGALLPHFYGEPLLDDRLPDLLTYARRRLPAVLITLFTNGTLLTPQRYTDLVKAGVNSFVITEHRPIPLKEEIVARHRQVGNRGVQLKFLPKKINEPIFNRCGIIELERVTDEKRTCEDPSCFIPIDWQGNVLLCCNDYFSEFQLGNIRNEKIQAIWNKPYNKKIRDTLKTDTSKSALCRRCKIGIFKKPNASPTQANAPEIAAVVAG